MVLHATNKVTMESAPRSFSYHGLLHTTYLPWFIAHYLSTMVYCTLPIYHGISLHTTNLATMQYCTLPIYHGLLHTTNLVTMVLHLVKCPCVILINALSIDLTIIVVRI